MGISTQGATNVSLNTAATFVGASPKSLRTVGGKTYPLLQHGRSNDGYYASKYQFISGYSAK